MFLMKRMCTESTPILIDNAYENNTEPHLSASSDDEVSQLSIGPEECVICLEPIEIYSAYSFDCGHQLHVECFHRYFLYNYDYERNYISCPVCRQEVNINEVITENKQGWKHYTISVMKFLGTISASSITLYIMLIYMNNSY